MVYGPDATAGRRAETDRKALALRLEQAEQARQAAEERYARLVAAVTDYAYTVSVAEGRVVATQHGPGCAAVTGYASEDFVANPMLWVQMIPAEDRSLVENHASRWLAGEETGPIEHRIVHRDGSIRWVRNTPVLHRDETGRLVSYDGLVRDVTDRKDAERYLRESEERFRVIFEQAAVGMAQVHPDGRISRVNDKLCEISATLRTSCSTAPSSISPTRPTRPAAIDWRWARSRRDADYSFEKRYQRKDGSVVWCKVTTALVRRAGESRSTSSR